MDESRSHPEHYSEPGPLTLADGEEPQPSILQKQAEALAGSSAHLGEGIETMRVEALSLALVALALAGAAQYLFMREGRFSLPALGCALLAIPSFLLAAVVADPPALVGSADSTRSRLIARILAGSWRLVLVVAAAGLTFFNLGLLMKQPPLQNYNITWLPWLGAIVLFLLANTGPRSKSLVASVTHSRLRAALLLLSQSRTLVLAVAAIVISGFALRIVFITTIPYTVGGDEGSQGMDAVRVLKGEITNPFTLGWLSVPTMAGYFNAITVKLFGNSILGLRLGWSLIGSTTVLITFLLVRRLQGTTVALLTSALLAAYHYHIHYSRIGAVQIADPFFTALALLFLYRGFDRNSRIDWALCGVVTGVAQYAYAGARSAALLILVIMLYLFLRGPRKFAREHGLSVAVMFGSFLIAAAPMILVAIRFPQDYNARLNAVGILQNGWLEHEQTIRGTGPIPILLDQMKRAVLAYNAYPDRVVWYGSPRPLFDFAWGALFLLGMGYGLLTAHRLRMFPMVIWWWSVIILGGALTESPPSSQRLLGSSVPAVFFVALALAQVGRTLYAALGQPRLKALAVPAMLVAIAGLGSSSVLWYFRDYVPMGIYGSVNGLVATELARYEHEHFGPDDRVFFLGAPRMVYRGFSTLPYLVPEVEAIDLDQALTAPPNRDLVGTDKHAAFVILPERRQELDLIRQTFPGGTLLDFMSPFNQEQVLFTMYRLERQQLLQP